MHSKSDAMIRLTRFAEPAPRLTCRPTTESILHNAQRLGR
jgi:hypothetical protein